MQPQPTRVIFRQRVGLRSGQCRTRWVQRSMIQVERGVVASRSHTRYPAPVLASPSRSLAPSAKPDLRLASRLSKIETRARMNRIEDRFAALQSAGQKGLIIYIGAGDPDLQATFDLALAFDQAGVDLLELGVPFSDPLADGPVNQLAAQRGLASGTTPARVLDTVRSIRQHSAMPIVLYLYYNLVHRHGLERFVQQAADAGVDGLLVLDLPPEEAADYEASMRQFDLANIYLVAPTTPDPRVASIARHARGFIYYVSREGVTGMQSTLASQLEPNIARIRAHTRLPVAVGFGISNPDQARAVARYADAVVVGSAVVDQIAQHGSSPDLVKRITAVVQSIARAVKGNGS
jgi:tryptophan synthase alpha chain